MNDDAPSPLTVTPPGASTSKSSNGVQLSNEHLHHRVLCQASLSKSSKMTKGGCTCPKSLTEVGEAAVCCTIDDFMKVCIWLEECGSKKKQLAMMAWRWHQQQQRAYESWKRIEVSSTEPMRLIQLTSTHLSSACLSVIDDGTTICIASDSCTSRGHKSSGLVVKGGMYVVLDSARHLVEAQPVCMRNSLPGDLAFIYQQEEPIETWAQLCSLLQMAQYPILQLPRLFPAIQCDIKAQASYKLALKSFLQDITYVEATRVENCR